MSKIGLFDMDGTLFDYDTQIDKGMKAIMAPGEALCDDYYDESKPYLKARLDLIKSQPGWWKNLPKLKLGWDVYDMAKKLGFEIEIITKGPTSKRRAWMEKGECIDAHFDDSVTINVLGKNKSRYFGHFLCEDYVPYLEGWLEHRPRGLGILIANKKNAGFAHPDVIRYHGPNADIVERCLKAVLNRRDGEHWKEYL